jgi:monomeric isocitrate dehydrogenase
MKNGDFFGSEKSITIADATDVKLNVGKMVIPLF